MRREHFALHFALSFLQKKSAGDMSSETLTCNVAVIGRTRERGLKVDGVGKSSLCSRFVLPSYDDYQAFGERHSPLLRDEDFLTTPQINGDHFVYHGSTQRQCRTSSHKRPVVFHVVEQTSFSSAQSLQKFPARQGVPRSYPERATQLSLQSPGKVAYLSSELLGEKGRTASTLTRTRQPKNPNFPSQFRVDGFVFVVDGSRLRHDVDDQVKILRDCLFHVGSETPLVVALTKGDLSEQASTAKEDFEQALMTEVSDPATNAWTVLDRQVYLANLAKLEWFTVSARRGVNVDEPFVRLAAAALKLPGRWAEPTPYERADALRVTRIELTERKVRGLVKRFGENSDQAGGLRSFLVKQTPYRELIMLNGQDSATCTVEDALKNLRQGLEKPRTTAGSSSTPRSTTPDIRTAGGQLVVLPPKPAPPVDRRTSDTSLIAPPARPPKPRQQWRGHR